MPRAVEKDWRSTKVPKSALSRPAAARADLTCGTMIRRELTARISSVITRKVFDEYHTDPKGFAVNHLYDEETVPVWSPVQDAMFASLAAGEDPVLCTAEDVGGSYGAAVATLWWLHCCGPSSKVLYTAPDKLECRAAWANVKQLIGQSPRRLAGRVLQDQIDIAESWYGSCFPASHAVDYAEGTYKRLLVIVDAADRYPEDAWSTVLDLIDEHGARFILLGRPNADGLWGSLCYNKPCFSAITHPNVKQRKEVIPGCCTISSIGKIERKYGTDSPEYRQRVLAEPVDFNGPITADDSRAVQAGSLMDAIRNNVNSAVDSRLAQNEYNAMTVSKFAGQRLFVRDKRGKIVPFKIWPLQKFYEDEKAKAAAEGYTKVILLKYRRGGFTTYEQAESYKLAANSQNARCLTLAHTEESTSEIFGISQRYWQNDPERPKIKGVGNARRLVFPDLQSVYFTATASGNAPGRGDTLSRVHGSEVSKWGKGPNQTEFVRDLMAGLSEACSHGHMVMESTADGIDGWFCPTYREAKIRANDWYPIFLPWFLDPLNCAEDGTYDADEIAETINAEEKEFIAYVAGEFGVTLTMAQLAWRRIKKRSLGALFPQEYPEDDETCFLTSGTAYYDIQYLLQMRKTMDRCPRERQEHVPGGTIFRYKPPRRGQLYVAGSDTSEGIPGGDLNNVCIKDKRTGEQVAWAHGLWRPEKLAEIGVQLCREYNNAIWGIERQNHGHAVILTVKRMGYRYLYKFDGKRPGWDTNSTTRAELLTDDRVYALDSPDKIHDDTYIGQCLTFKLQKNGKFEADEGCHDDAIFGWGVAEQVRQRAGHASIVVG